MYIPPTYKVDNGELDQLIGQLSSPFILLGDMNAYNIAWRNSNTNPKGHYVEIMIPDNNVCLWNDGSPTHIHPATGSISAIDLAMCSPSLFMDFEWDVHDDLCSSDNFPTLLRFIKRVEPTYVPKWNFKKADWLEFKTVCPRTGTSPNAKY